MEEERPLREAREAISDSDSGGNTPGGGSGRGFSPFLLIGIVAVVVLIIAGLFFAPHLPGNPPGFRRGGS